MTLNIPDWWSVEAKCQSVGEDGLSELEAFVHAFEPSSASDAAVFAQALQRALDEVIDRVTTPLRDSIERHRRHHALSGDVISNQCIAMQSALIEERLGNGAEAAMVWIYNTLRGPGLLPDLEEARQLGGAQAWFDARSAEHDARLLAARSSA